VIWLRKWNNLHHLNLLWQLESSRTAIDLFKLLNKELSLVSGSFFNLFSKKKWLTKPEALKVNKLDVLNLAKSVGFNVPDTIVTNSREICLCFLKKHEHIITKCISDAGYFKAYDQYHVLYTSQVGKTDLDNAPEYFYPSLFQKFIKKKYELRVFFLNDQCYAMAIFSQKNDKTKVDFRRYDNSAPNRTVPYKLPKSLQRKIISLMKRLCLNTGSIDLLVSSDNEYVFLEVNPVGQFGMVSKPCNFGLENIIAKYLISYDNE
jgi:ATP-GRASP peptide maturase of grasp-with-spasm system